MFLSGIVASVFLLLEGVLWGAEGSGGGSSTGRPVFLTSVEVADMLRVSPRTLEKMRLEKRGPLYIRLGKNGKSKVIYRLEDVLAWADSHSVR